MREQRMMRAGHLSRSLGLAALASRIQPPDNVRVTLTHYVADGDVDNFGRLVDQLREEREPVEPASFVQAWADTGGAPIEGRRVLFTFDDGLMSSYDAIQRVLNPRGIKAMFFVPTMILGLRSSDEMRDFFRRNVYRSAAGTLPPDRYVAVSTEHLRELHVQGHMVLPHTHSHAPLSTLTTPAAIDEELRMPKQLLEEMLQSPAPGFAFPVGTERVVNAISYEAVRRIYSVCFSGLGGVNTATTDRHYLYRDCIHPYFKPEHAANVMAGSYDLFYRYKMWRLERLAGRRGA